ncbi:phosphoribosyltransferase [Bdellovibrio bacteriovorus]|nr:phosphoribosyltransferase [Bdellovibrio bacteriovorus]
MRGLQIRSLYRWVPGRSDILSRLILWLKGSRQKEAWHYYAKEMSRNYCETLPRNFKIYVVPAPSKKGQTDHAMLWAQGLSQALGAELLPCLRKTGQYAQRGADRGTRALIEMELIENNTDTVDFESQILWIFADDIVTTGATARSAHIALGRPANFQIWALAQRSLSCGASKDLL